MNTEFEKRFVVHNGRRYPYIERSKEARQARIQKLIEVRLTQSNMRHKLVDGIDEYDPSVHYKGTKSLESVEKLQRYAKDPTTYATSSLYMEGPYNTQKTTLAQWTALQRITQGQKVYYVLMRTLLNALVDKQHDRGDDKEASVTRNDMLKRVEAADLLIIDEAFDQQKMTMYKSGYQLPFLDEFLRDRIDVKQRPVIFISNVSIGSINDQFASLRSLLERRIKLVGGELSFRDNFVELANDFDVKDIFA